MLMGVVAQMMQPLNGIALIELVGGDVGGPEEDILHTLHESSLHGHATLEVALPEAKACPFPPECLDRAGVREFLLRHIHGALDTRGAATGGTDETSLIAG